jgi:hypothetical protein
MALLMLLWSFVQAGTAQLPRAMQADVDGLVRAAEALTGTWPSQPPPPIPEVARVARHGHAIVPLLLSLLSDDQNAERDPKRWRVQQQVSLVLSRIYPGTEFCGRIYCDGDPPGRTGNVKAGWQRYIASEAALRALSSAELIDRFRREKEYFRQFDLARALAATGARDAIGALEGWLTHEDRHLRGNAAFVLGRLGDPRGFQTIAAMLADHSPRPRGQGGPPVTDNPRAQIRADRYWAAHLLGDLKDPQGVPLLISLLSDTDTNYIAQWALAGIGDRRAIAPLIRQLDQDDPSLRVLAIDALATLNAREALPRLQALQKDTRPSNFGGLVTVAEAARRAIAVIS